MEIVKMTITRLRTNGPRRVGSEATKDIIVDVSAQEVGVGEG
jgi:hypothetical protein